MVVRVHETQADLDRLQHLLDESYARSGAHLRSIITPDRRIDAAAVAEQLTGIQVLALATVTAAGEPRVSPVDAVFYRGHFYFGSGTNSAKFRHIRKRPAVSGTVTAGESLAITVHGTAVEIDTATDEVRGYLVECYGDDWSEWAGDAPYARIDAKQMFTFQTPK
jgi:uncharacterized pyridoxamine 5'-phosphate oxidase family protein